MTADDLETAALVHEAKYIQVRIIRPDGSWDLRQFLGFVTTRGGTLRIRHADRKGETWFPVSDVYDVTILSKEAYKEGGDTAFNQRREYMP